MPNLKFQINSAINDAFVPGRSKRSDKFSQEGLEWRIYSYSHKDSMHEVGKNLMGFCSLVYGVRLVNQITPDMLQAWLDSKASTCNELTLKGYLSNLKKLDLIVAHKFSCNSWGTSRISLPAAVKVGGLVKDKIMSDEVADSVIREMRRGDALTWRSVELSKSLGLRIEETVGVYVKDLHLDSSGDGFGVFEIRKGCGAKGNRPRTIPIPDAETATRLADMVHDMDSESLIVYNVKTGDKLTKDAPNKAFVRALTKLDLYEEYKANLNHALRKNFATKYFNEYRKTHSRKDTVGRVNEILGHGRQRSESELKAYVHDIY